jgi:ribosomal-protein-alanine N-acetyltransferase
MEENTFTKVELPILETERLRLRMLKLEDAEDVFIMRSDPDVMKYIPRPMAKSIDDAVALINLINESIQEQTKFNWGITFKDTDQVIGIIGFPNIKLEHARAEIGYTLTKKWHRHGIMKEALKCVMKYGFEKMRLHTIEAIIDAENIASGSLLKSVGFREEAYFKEDFLFNGIFRNSIHFGMLDSEAKQLGIIV